HSRWREVVHFHPHTHGGGTDVKIVGDRSHGGGFGPRDQARGRQHGHVAGTQGLRGVLVPDGEGHGARGTDSRSGTHSSTTRTSPSCTTSPASTVTSVTVPPTSDSTGISIFMDSRINSVVPGSTTSPRATDTE